MSSMFVKKLNNGIYPRIAEYLRNRFDIFEGYKVTFLRMMHNIEKHPICKVCGKYTKFNLRRYKTEGKIYDLYCSRNCANVANLMKSQSTKEQRYGTKGYNNRNKARKTCIVKYGVDNPKKNEDIKRKSEETCMKRYGVRYPTQMSSVIEYTHTKECIARQNNTKRKNHTFNTSSIEEFLYKELLKKFEVNDVIRQYNDKEKYPYNCDFYIPSIDTFIELQGHWTHGEHPYNPDSIEDQEKVKEWKSKHTKYYDNAIRTWTVSDVKKREIAKKNKLRYIEIFSIKKDEILKEISILCLNKK